MRIKIILHSLLVLLLLSSQCILASTGKPVSYSINLLPKESTILINQTHSLVLQSVEKTDRAFDRVVFEYNYPSGFEISNLRASYGSTLIRNDKENSRVSFHWGNGVAEAQHLWARFDISRRTPGNFLITMSKVRYFADGELVFSSGAEALVHVVEKMPRQQEAAKNSSLANQAPLIAIEGLPYRITTPGQLVNLDASQSVDDDEITSYLWEQMGGPPIELSTMSGPVASFISPVVSADRNIDLQLTVKDKQGAFDRQRFSIEVPRLNQAPVASITVNSLPAKEGEKVILDGSASSDDRGVTSYEWQQFSGPEGIKLVDFSSSKASFTAPVLKQDADMGIRLTVSDTEGLTDIKEITIPIKNINNSPIAKITVPRHGVVGKSLSLSGGQSSDVDGDSLSFNWDLGDGAVANSERLEHVYTAPGEYRIKLVVADGKDGSGEAVEMIRIEEPNSNPVARISGQFWGAVDEDVVFDASQTIDPDQDALTFLWDFGDGSVVERGERTFHKFTTQGEYQITLTVTDSNGGQSIAHSKAIIEKSNAPPVAKMKLQRKATIDEIVKLDASQSFDPDDDKLSYFWDYGDGVKGAGKESTHRYESAGNYPVELKIVDSNGEYAVARSSIEIVKPNTRPVAKISVPETTEINEILVFDGSESVDLDGDDLAYQWDFGDGSIETGIKKSHIYSHAGNYSIKLKVTDSAGSSHTISMPIEIIEPNSPPLADAGGFYEGEVDQEIRFSGSGSFDPDGDRLTYRWQFGDGNSSTGETVKHAYNSPGRYTAILVVQDDDDSSVSRAEVNVIKPNTVPVARVKGTDIGDTDIIFSFDGSASEDADGDNLTYQWDFGDGEIAKGSAVKHQYKNPGKYTVSLIVDDGKDYSEVAEKRVTINKSNEIPIADASGPYSGLVSQEIKFDGGASSDPDGDTLEYFWDFGDGATGTGKEPKHLYNLPGEYVVSLIVKDQFSGSVAATTRAKIVKPNVPPVAVIRKPSPTLLNQTIELDGSLSSDEDDESLSYHWNFGDGAEANTMIATHRYSEAGQYLVRLRVTDNKSRSSTAEAIIEIVEPNLPPIVNAGGSYQGKTGVVVSFSAEKSQDPDSDNLSYSWDFGDGTTGVGEIVHHVYMAAGEYPVILSVNDGYNEVVSIKTKAIIAQENRQPQWRSSSKIKQAVSGPAYLQVGETGEFSSPIAIDPDGDEITYTFYWGDGSHTSKTISSQDSISQSHSWADPGEFKVYVTASEASTESNNSPVIYSSENKIIIEEKPGIKKTLLPEYVYQVGEGNQPLAVSFNKYDYNENTDSQFIKVVQHHSQKHLLIANSGEIKVFDVKNSKDSKLKLLQIRKKAVQALVQHPVLNILYIKGEKCIEAVRFSSDGNLEPVENAEVCGENGLSAGVAIDYNGLYLVSANVKNNELIKSVYRINQNNGQFTLIDKQTKRYKNIHQPLIQFGPSLGGMGVLYTLNKDAITVEQVTGQGLSTVQQLDLIADSQKADSVVSTDKYLLVANYGDCVGNSCFSQVGNFGTRVNITSFRIDKSPNLEVFGSLSQISGLPFENASYVGYQDSGIRLRRPAMEMAGEFLYLADNNGISAFHFDSKSGSLKPVHENALHSIVKPVSFDQNVF
ncbi:MAG: PKD domain-containing protein [Gammaproteobacteria bacterium]